MIAAMSSETFVRVRTALIGAAIFLFLLTIGGTVGTSFCTAILSGLMCLELSHLFYSLPDRQEKVVGLVGTAWLVLFANIIFPKSMLECLLIAFAGMFAYFLAVADRHPNHLRRHFDEFVFTMFVLIYVVVCAAFLPLIRQSVHGAKWTLLFLFIVWASDTGAYFVGRKYGRRKLYPLISPGKSVEGALGGLGAGLLVSLLFKLIAFKNLGWLGAIIIPIAIGTFSQIGDLCESFLKRAYGIKDSGQILPGHGGVLDRFDGVIFSLPLMYFCVKIFSAA